MKTALALLLFLPAWSAAHAGEPVALLQPGETLTYHVGWGMLGHAGTMTISAQSVTIDDTLLTRITTTSATRGFVRMLYPFDGSVQTFFDPLRGRLLAGAAKTRTRKQSTHSDIAIDYEKREATYTDHVRPSRSSSIALPDGTPLDLITALVQTRLWSLRPGDSRDALVLFDDDFYPLRITAVREETLRTANGPRKTVLLIPSMPESPKGIFRRGGEILVWVSADADSLPLRFEVKLKVGTAYATLTERRPASGP